MVTWYLCFYETEGCWGPLLPALKSILPVLARVPSWKATPCCSLTPACCLLSMLVSRKNMDGACLRLDLVGISWATTMGAAVLSPEMGFNMPAEEDATRHSLYAAGPRAWGNAGVSRGLQMPPQTQGSQTDSFGLAGQRGGHAHGDRHRVPM